MRKFYLVLLLVVLSVLCGCASKGTPDVEFTPFVADDEDEDLILKPTPKPTPTATPLETAQQYSADDDVVLSDEHEAISTVVAEPDEITPIPSITSDAPFSDTDTKWYIEPTDAKGVFDILCRIYNDGDTNSDCFDVAVPSLFYSIEDKGVRIVDYIEIDETTLALIFEDNTMEQVSYFVVTKNDKAFLKSIEFMSGNYYAGDANADDYDSDSDYDTEGDGSDY